jgi:hypothetical protein
VGLDNVDIPAATAAGVMVVNAPTSNIVSAAELAIIVASHQLDLSHQHMLLLRLVSGHVPSTPEPSYSRRLSESLASVVLVN